MNLEEFKNKLEAKNPIQVSRSIDACDWFFGEIMVFHERTYWRRNIRASSPLTPASIFHGCFNSVESSFWGNTSYKEIEIAESDSKKYKTASVEKEFYCDDSDPSWFLIFEDFDEASDHAFSVLTKQGYFDLIKPCKH